MLFLSHLFHKFRFIDVFPRSAIERNLLIAESKLSVSIRQETIFKLYRNKKKIYIHRIQRFSINIIIQNNILRMVTRLFKKSELLFSHCLVAIMVNELSIKRAIRRHAITLIPYPFAYFVNLNYNQKII